MAKKTHTELSRDLGLFTITMVGVGAMIGAGIFVLTGIAAGTAGPALILAFAANGLVTFLTALAYAELGSAIPEAGGGYLWVKEGLPGPNAFLAGWMSWFAHAVAGSLYALGFSSYLGFMLKEMGVLTLAGIPIEAAIFQKGLAVLIALIFVAINFKGVSETGLAGNIVTMAKIIIIGIFIGSGLYAMFNEPASWEKFTPFAPEGFAGVLSAMGLTYIAFEGYEIIVQAGEEVKDPKRNIPRAVFWSLAIVIPIYILVAITAIGAIDTGTSQATWQWLGEYKELGLAEAARQFMPLGTTLLLIGGILSTMSALNATTFSSTRVSFAMGRDRNLPDFFAEINEKTKTPYLALICSGGLIIFMALAVPIEDVAAAADVMFLLLFLQVNMAIITIRRKYGDKLDYGFLIPFFPVVPIVAIILMIGIAVFMFHFSPIAWYFVIGWISTGFVIYYTYARKRKRMKSASPVVLQQSMPIEKERYRIMIPVANPSTSKRLIDFAAMIARAKGGELVLVHVITVPKQAPLRVGQQFIKRVRDDVLDEAVEIAENHDLPVSSVMRIARKPAKGIIDEVEERNIDMIVMGWKGSSKHSEAILGSNVDKILRDADCDIAILRGDNFGEAENILLPVAFPQSAKLMFDIGKAFEEEQGSKINICHVIPPKINNNKEAKEERLESLYEVINEDKNEESEAPKRTINVQVSKSVVSQIVRLSKESDIVVLGAAEEGWFRKMVAGSRTEQIARLVKGNLILVKPRRGSIKSGLQDVIEFFRSKEPESNE
ncbi:MAG: amino acid permease [Gracilimonas sp.]|uniref:amino acid permease n=1 Tax=Gracilimonas sp. TaxID=1974203 RepID=UPI003752B2C8|nr:amino acid permease [Gracilimonas sp.]